MALIIAIELQQFYQFIGCQLEQDSVGMSPEECLDNWRVQHPSPEELADSVAAIRTALEEARRGEGQAAHEVIAELHVRGPGPEFVPGDELARADRLRPRCGDIPHASQNCLPTARQDAVPG